MTPLMFAFDSQKRIVEDILTERQRQDTLKAAGKFKYTCAECGLLDAERYLVLGEEFGEIGRALLNEHRLAVDGRPPDVRQELIQLIAVAVAWVEHLDLGEHEADR